MRFPFFTLLPLASVTTACCVAWLIPATAQIIPDQTLGIERSNVTPNVPIRGINSDRIDGGAIRNSNLFHSFREFNIKAGRGAYFVNPAGIENILTRVTGENVSNIFGTLGVLGGANLFLINPNGIVFGPNARLDVGGSFFASTADGILFENGVEFAARNPEAPPLLTINIPLGLNIRENPGRIVVQGTGHNLRFDPKTGATIRDERPVGLQVPFSQTLALVGGDVILEGGNLTAEAGRIELGSIASVGQVRLPVTTGEGLSYDRISSFGNIQLSQAASVDVSGEGGGNIQVQGRQIQFRDGGVMLADTLGSQPGGSVTVRASESLELTGTTPEDPFPSGLFAQVSSEATGKGGSLTIETERLTLSSGAQISTGTFGAGAAGDLTVRATQVELIGIEKEGAFSSGLSAQVEATATGQGGSLRIETEHLRLSGGAQISAGTSDSGVENSASGDGGEITIKATEVELMGTVIVPESEVSSGLFVGGNIGKGGNLTLDTQRLIITGGAQILGGTFGLGDAGNLTIRAEEIELIGTSVTGRSSNLFAGVALEATGEGGTLRIETESLRLSGGAQISTVTFGAGAAGNLTVRAKEVELIGLFVNPDNGSPSVSGLFTQVESEATGKGGTLRIETEGLRLSGGAQISAVTFGAGDAGDLAIKATEVELMGGGISPLGRASSGLFARTDKQSTGDGGTLTVTADQLMVRDGARITVSSRGTGEAGNLAINVPSIRLNNQASLRAETRVGTQGNITINSSDIRLREGSTITTNSLETGTGGNITINSNQLVAIENSDISANALAGSGGQVIINSDAIFGTQFRQQQTSASDITATSELGAEFSGTVELNNEIDPAQGLVDLPQTVVDPTALIAQDVCRQGQGSEFVNTGRGGLPPSPEETVRSEETFVSLMELPPEVERRNNSQTQRNSRTLTRQQRNTSRTNNQPISSLAPRLRSGQTLSEVETLDIVPARGWIRNSEGDIILVGYDPTKTGVQRQRQRSTQCQP